MDIEKATNPDAISEWLKDRPSDQAQIITVRAALREFPKLIDDYLGGFADYTLLPFRAAALSWARSSFPTFGIDQTTFSAAFDRTVVAFAHHKVSRPLLNNRSQNVFYTSERAAAAAVDEAHFDFSAIDNTNDHFEASEIAKEDCRWLAKQADGLTASRRMAARSLWLGQASRDWLHLWQRLSNRLLTIDPNYAVWIDWYERRIRGERAAFDIPGDKGRKEDKKILRRLAEASDEDFWGKGHEYVNATLKSWLDEARARVAPPPPPDEDIAIPPQESGAIAYGVNAQGKLDRLPHSDQTQLRNVPDQRRAYADLRQTALELREEGQRLGPRLLRGLDRFTGSLPERFENAETYPIWRDANALRRLYRAHREAAKSSEPDEAKLEPVIAETLGGLIDLYNNFAFADDGLRAKDEQRIAPQERVDAEEEASAAAPLITEILKTPEVATERARDDLAAEADVGTLPNGGPYAAQSLDQSNRNTRNWFAGFLEGAKKALANPKLLGKRAAVGLAQGAGQAVGLVAMKTLLGINAAPIVEFIATHGAAFKNFVTVAFPTFEHLPDLIERIRAWWQSIGSE